MFNIFNCPLNCRNHTFQNKLKPFYCQLSKTNFYWRNQQNLKLHLPNFIVVTRWRWVPHGTVTKQPVTPDLHRNTENSWLVKLNSTADYKSAVSLAVSCLSTASLEVITCKHGNTVSVFIVQLDCAAAPFRRLKNINPKRCVDWLKYFIHSWF